MPVAPGSPALLVGAFGNRSGPRSRNGCRTCREKKVKCDENRPVCQRCQRLRRVCHWPHALEKRARPICVSSLPSALARRRDSLDEEDRTDRRSTASVSFSPGGDSPDTGLSGPSQAEEDLTIHALPRAQTPTPVVLSPASPPRTASPLPSLPLISSTHPSGIDLGPEDHGAIFLYRTRFAISVDTKNPAYSLPAIILQHAVSSPAVMHMVLALGRQHVCLDALGYHLSAKASRNRLLATDHYCQALKLLGDSSLSTKVQHDLESVLSALLLLLVYEQRFGERPALTVHMHLRGVASVLSMANCQRFFQKAGSLGSADMINAVDQEASIPSYLAARLILWLVGIDARATTFGSGGVLNSELAKKSHVDYGKLWDQALEALHESSAPLFQTIWGPGYPAAEILYDIEHKGLFDLYRDCAQLRLSIAQLTTVSCTEQRAAKTATIRTKIQSLSRQHRDLFALAAAIAVPGQALDHGLLTSICWVLPHHHANVVNFYSAVDNRADPDFSDAIRQIAKLAMHGYRGGGIAALLRVAWPLFVAGVETPDLIHEQWIMDRFVELARCGQNYQLALQKLEHFLQKKHTLDQDKSRVMVSVDSVHFLQAGFFL